MFWGITFGGGLVVVHSQASASRASRLIAEAFPEFPGEYQAFAQDWMGRQYAVGVTPDTQYPQQLLLFEPASGDAFGIDAEIPDLFNVEFVSDPITYFAADLFADWIRAGGRLGWPDGCVGFKAPLFLGGEGVVENLEVIDLEVYWSLLGQLRSGTKDLAAGAKISEVTIDQPE
nr:DUF1851 domain-containing protein [Micromonospora sp. DSM 115978]